MSDKTGAAPYRELTVPALVVGVIIGVLMTASFVYIALKLGFGLGGSTVAAILGFAVLKGVLKKGTIVENNINQTVASGVNTASAATAFTLPALFLIQAKDPSVGEIHALPFILAAVAGSFMGILLIIPLRKQMIEFERLRFPSGIAVSTLLKSPGAGAQQAKLLLGGFLVAAIMTLLDRFHVIPEEIDFGTLFGMPSYVPIVVSLSFANIGAGLLAGRGGLAFVAGGVLAWWIVSPIAVNMGWVPDPGLGGDQAKWIVSTIRYEMIRPVGIGMLIGGALMGVLLSLPALKGALANLSKAAAMRGAGAPEPEEMGTKVLYIGLAAAILALFGAAMISTDNLTVFQGIMVAVIGAVWLGLAGLVVAQATGMTDISPLSGMALIAVTLMFFVTAGNVVASVLLGVAVCIGIGQCADMMQDLKTGHLVGSRPRKQQIAQFSVAWIGAPIAVGTVFLLWGDGGGFGPGTGLEAPQAGALQAIVEGLREGNVPLEKYVVGTGLGAALGLYPVSGLGVLIGLAMYLPISITLGYGVGCVASIGLERKLGKRWIGSILIPVAAGFIVGEALTSLIITLIKLSTGG